jgi:hypothetical protein
MCVREEIVADAGAAIDDHMREQNRIRANVDILVDHHIRADVRASTDSCRRMNHSRRMNPRRVLRRPVEQLHRAREGQVGVFGAQGGGGNCRKVFGDDHCRRRRGAGHRRIFRVGHERDLAGHGFFNAGDTGDLCFRRPIFKACSED